MNKELLPIIAGTSLIAGAAASVFFMYSLIPGNCYTGQVTGVERVMTSETSHYRVYMRTAQGNIVFKNEDDLLRGKWNSSNIQASLRDAEQTGQEVTIEAWGWRFPFLSMFPNIVREHSEADVCRTFLDS